MTGINVGFRLSVEVGFSIVFVVLVLQLDLANLAFPTDLVFLVRVWF